MLTVDPELVTRLCQAAITGGAAIGVGSVERDPLDQSVWVSMTSWPQVEQAITALAAYGLAVREAGECRVQVVGWYYRLLHRRLATALSGVDDLGREWDATAELVRFQADRRLKAGEELEPAEVLEEVERTMRRCVPIPHAAPRTEDIDALLQLVEAAEEAYQELVAQHLDYAELILAQYLNADG